MITLEEGKVYKTRDGRKATWDEGPDQDGDIILCVDGDTYRCYRTDGTHGGYTPAVLRNSNLDIVAEWEEKPAMKQPKKGFRLVDLDVRKGDVVCMVWNDILEEESNEVKTIVVDGIFPHRDADLYLHGFEVVSRALDTQVQTHKKVKDMTDAELGTLVRKFAYGEAIETSFDAITWEETTGPIWLKNLYYRVKPEVIRQKIMMNATSRDQVPYFNTYMSDPTHNLTFVWKDGKLIDVEYDEV